MNLNPDTSLALMQASQSEALNAVNATKNVTKDKTNERYEAVSKDFEAMFMTEMLKPMFAELKPDPRFGGGKGEEIFSGMMLQEYGKMMAETGQIGIADAVKQELIRIQGEADNKPTDIHTTNKNVDKNLGTILEEQINAE